MKTIALLVLIIFILLQPANAIFYRPVELAPDNLESNGFSIRFFTTKENENYQIFIVFDKLPAFFATHREARLVIQDDHNLVSSVILKPIGGSSHKQLSYSFLLSPRYIAYSYLCLSEGSGTSFDHWFEVLFSKFMTLNQSPPANP